MNVDDVTWPSLTGGQIDAVMLTVECEEEPWHLAFFVAGTPRPAGSKRVFRRADGGLNVTHDCAHTGAWMAMVAAEALKARSEAGLRVLTTGVEITAAFRFRRPRSHYQRDGHLFPGTPALPVSHRVPDLDKLARACCDALSGIIYFDDSQVVALSLRKEWGEQEGVAVEMREAG